jgi:acetyl coenzyme A synthetase (ADP forming)-like protein
MLESLLYPKSVAVVGASRNPAKVGHAILKNIIEGGFEGRIIVINPSADEILGVKSYKSFSDYKEGIDLSVIVVPTLMVKDAVKDSVDYGVKAICVITAGFKEIGAEGAKLQREIANICKAANVRMLGPNVVGLINPHHKFNASFATRLPLTGNVAVVSQSGAVCTILLDWAYGEGLGLASLISIGNKADLDEVDFIETLSHDEKTKVIAGYLEDIQDGDKFINTAQEAAHRKPIIIMKAGTSKSGAKAASSHTGSLAGADIAYGAAFRRAGIIRAETFAQLLDFSMALSMQPLPEGDNIAIITNAGGPGIMAADALEEVGFSINPLSKETTEKLRKLLPAAASVNNPIDVLGDATPELYVEAINAAQDDPSIDAIMCLTAPQAMTAPTSLAQGIINCARGKKPILTVFMGGYEMRAAHELLMTNGIPEYHTPNRAANSLMAMRDYHRWLKRPPRIVTRFPVNRRRVERVISRHIRMGHPQIGEVESKDILSAYDFTVPEGYLATNASEAVDVASRVGYPVAMKISSPDIIHKSDFGGVKLNLADKGQVEDAFDLMMLRIKRKAPEACIDGVYVEKMGQRGREVILGMSRDPQFGPMLMFGLGGIFVEVMKDVTFYLAPITAEEAMQMMKGTRSYALLQGARGQAAVNMEGIATALQRISQLVTDFPEIVEMDINPLMVGEPGTEPFVADARMTLSRAVMKND